MSAADSFNHARWKSFRHQLCDCVYSYRYYTVHLKLVQKSGFILCVFDHSKKSKIKLKAKRKKKGKKKAQERDKERECEEVRKTEGKEESKARGKGVGTEGEGWRRAWLSHRQIKWPENRRNSPLSRFQRRCLHRVLSRKMAVSFLIPIQDAAKEHAKSAQDWLKEWCHTPPLTLKPPPIATRPDCPFCVFLCSSKLHPSWSQAQGPQGCSRKCRPLGGCLWILGN